MTPVAGWANLSLAEISEGGLFTDGDWVESKDQDEAGAVRLTQLADVGDGYFRDRSNRWLREDQAEALNCTFLRPRDVLIARMPDPLGRACLVPDDIGRAVTVVDVALLRVVRPDVDPRYVMWAINSPDFRQRVATLASGTTRKRISRRNLSSLTLPVPPLEEQRRIVDALEGHLSRLDAAERELHGAAGRLARLRDQVIRHALFPSSPLTTPSAVPLPDVGVNDGELPDLPNNWHWARLGELSEVVGGVTKDSSKQGDPTFVEVPYLRVANVQRGRLDLDVITKIRVPPDKAAKLELLPGDVLLNEGGDRDKLGRGWVWDGQIEQCIHQNHVFRARIRDGVLTPKLLSWAANSFGGRWCERNGKQSVNLASISLSKIRLMPVPVPPLGEQPAIERQIQAGLDGCDRLAASLAIARRESRALRRSLLGAAFTGGLSAAPTATDPREAAHV